MRFMVQPVVRARNTKLGASAEFDELEGKITDGRFVYNKRKNLDKQLIYIW